MNSYVAVVIMKPVIIFIFSFYFFIQVQSAVAQEDSVKSVNVDINLASSQNRTKDLIQIADSIQLSDSLQAAALEAEIKMLKDSERSRREALQAKIDSLNRKKAEQKIMLQHQVDSLRAVTQGVPLLFNGDTLFYVFTKLGPFSPTQRAESISKKLTKLGDLEDFDSNNLVVSQGAESDDMSYEDIIILSVTDADAFWKGMPRTELIEIYRERVVNAIDGYHSQFGIYNNIKRFLLLILVIFILVIAIKYMNRAFTALNIKLVKQSSRYISGLKIKNVEVLSQEREKQLLRYILKGIKWILIVFIIYISLPTIFSIFPATENLANQLFSYVLDPFKAIILGFLGYIPEMITIAVILVVTHYIVRFLRALALEIENEKIVINGFYSDWAKPTFNLVRIVIYAFAFITIFPYLPGSDSPVFKGVSVFIGVLISLGSTSAIGNIIAGLVITYMRPFKLGDRVKIGETTGDVMSKNLLVTRVKTIKNEDISIPNAAILNGSTINYTTNAEMLGLVLHSTVTIGYDVPWRKVHELLIDAAIRTEHVSKDPKPFVLQTSLDDFYVSYQINLYTNEAGLAARIYSELHSRIQDNFAEADVEIMSPHYRAERDGSEVAIPKGFKPQSGSPQVPPKAD